MEKMTNEQMEKGFYDAPMTQTITVTISKIIASSPTDTDPEEQI
jgi:hypothetical protein